MSDLALFRELVVQLLLNEDVRIEEIFANIGINHSVDRVLGIIRQTSSICLLTEESVDTPR